MFLRDLPPTTRLVHIVGDNLQIVRFGTAVARCTNVAVHDILTPAMAQLAARPSPGAPTLPPEPAWRASVPRPDSLALGSSSLGTRRLTHRVPSSRTTKEASEQL